MTPTPRTGFVRAEGTSLVDDQGPLLLRGVGLGNWLLPEGYMWGFGDDQSSPRQIEQRIASLVGPEQAVAFWRRFRDVFIAERDFALIADAGFDHVRLPINARIVMDESGAFLEEGFALIERAVAWSEKNGLRILLDLHGAPGGQTGTNIDDSEHGRPELFMDPTFRRHTIALWEEIARRFRSREAVLGYDLLNEPLPNEWQHVYNDELVALYRDLTAAIRAVDDRHLLMYEGSHWATNWLPLAERYDDNQALQFHRYWCPPDETSIDDFLAERRRLGTPIYMGEGGENSPAWIYAATRLYERHDIGWNFWPWKKLDTLTSPLSAQAPSGWELIVDPAATPSAEEAGAILDGFLNAVAADRCARRQPVLDALFGRPPLTLPAWAGLHDGGERSIDEMAGAPIPDAAWANPEDTGSAAHPITVALTAGSVLTFALASAPTGWTVHADDARDVAVTWEEGALVLAATATVAVHGVTVHT